MNIPQVIDNRIQNIMIGKTRLGSWNETINAPDDRDWETNDEIAVSDSF